MKFTELRETHPVFCYESFNYSVKNEQLEVTYRFTIGSNIVFSPKLTIPNRQFYNTNLLHKNQLDLLIFNIGLIELISYWKCTCSPTVVIKPFAISNEQIRFWKKLYFHGLGEFFYLNKIETTLNDFMTIECQSEQIIEKQHFLLNDEIIVPIGGGKDSVVTLELLRQQGESITPLIINPRGATLDCIKTAGFELSDSIEVNRTIDPALLELNEKGFLNGHTPFSAMLAFVSLLCAALSGKKHIALSNESSANESTIIGTEVNHQYSKSFEFENDFRNYVSTFISPDFNYFSFLRPLSELQIAKLFSKQTNYFPVFKSCNAGSKQNTWCGKCSKCLFVYIMLSPFIEPAKLQSIFGKDLLNDENLLYIFRQLTGNETEKPFECVGTTGEVNEAIQLSLQTFYTNEEELPLLIRHYKTEYNENNKLHTSALQTFDENHFLNSKFEKVLKKSL